MNKKEVTYQSFSFSIKGAGTFNVDSVIDFKDFNPLGQKIKLVSLSISFRGATNSRYVRSSNISLVSKDFRNKFYQGVSSGSVPVTLFVPLSSIVIPEHAQGSWYMGDINATVVNSLSLKLGLSLQSNVLNTESLNFMGSIGYVIE